MNKANIRRAKETELKHLQQLSEELTVSDSKYDPKLMKNWSYSYYGKQYLKSRISGRKHVCIVIEVDGEIVGYATGTVLNTLTWRKVKRVQLENLLIREQFRNQGLGVKLIDAFVAWGKEMKAERIMVEAYFANTGAVNFYKKNGFAENDIILEKSI